MIVELLRILVGNAWNRIATLLVIAGIGLLAGIWQYWIPAVGKLVGLDVAIPDPSPLIGISLIAAGILVLVFSRWLPERAPELQTSAIPELELLRAQIELERQRRLRHKQETRAPAGRSDTPFVQERTTPLGGTATPGARLVGPAVTSTADPTQRKYTDFEKMRLADVLYGLSAILNNEGLTAVRLVERFIQATQDGPGTDPEYPAAPKPLRDKAQLIANALELLLTNIYREFLPANRFYVKELTSVLGATSADLIQSPVYQFHQAALSYVGALHSAMVIAEASSDSAKADYVTRAVLGQTEQQYRTMVSECGRLRQWIESCNSRIEDKLASLQQ